MHTGSSGIQADTWASMQPLAHGADTYPVPSAAIPETNQQRAVLEDTARTGSGPEVSTQPTGPPFQKEIEMQPLFANALQASIKAQKASLRAQEALLQQSQKTSGSGLATK
ncbi:hypothetical protein MBLNU230_g7783t1 [Neophaeotheca triangularis]